MNILALPMALAMPTLNSMPIPADFYPPNITDVPFHTSPSYPGNFCNGTSYKPSNNGHAAMFSDCLKIMNYAQTSIGEWQLKTATTKDSWQMLASMGNCALLVQNTEPAVVSDKDVADLMHTIWMKDGIRDGPVEATGSWENCQVYQAPYREKATGVQFWVRDSNFAGNW
ncbi:hypothetical protein GGR57DRAFT_464670 [Xylariaceae sp. FL1272]|nr:hypothetical protein GGR57DRAFT_464670 [Xylariaceae sp. FL1272]